MLSSPGLATSTRTCLACCCPASYITETVAQLIHRSGPQNTGLGPLDEQWRTALKRVYQLQRQQQDRLGTPWAEYSHAFLQWQFHWAFMAPPVDGSFIVESGLLGTTAALAGSTSSARRCLHLPTRTEAVQLGREDPEGAERRSVPNCSGAEIDNAQTPPACSC